MRRSWRLTCLIILILTLTPTVATAGSLGDFKEAHNEASDSDESDPDDPFAEDGDPGELSDEEWLGAILKAIWGATPGEAFTFGEGPYAGRGAWLDGAALAGGGYGVATTDDSIAAAHALDGNADWRPMEVLVRGSGVVTSRQDAGGWDLHARLATTGTPAISVSHLYMYEPGSSEQLGLTSAAVEPRLLVNRWLTVSWGIGGSVLHDQDGALGSGPCLVTQVELFPIEPTFLDLRMQYHSTDGVTVGDFRTAAGVFFTSNLAAEIAMRHLAVSGPGGLTTFGLGIRGHWGLAEPSP